MERKTLLIALVFVISLSITMVNLLPSDDGLGIVTGPQMVKDFEESEGESWLTGFTYRKRFTFAADGDVGAVAFAMKLDVNYGSGTDDSGEVYCSSTCQTDFGDIRFTTAGGSTEVDYWIEEYTVSSDATFWVEMTLPAAGTSYGYMYWGNSTVSTTSSLEDTFLAGTDGSSVPSTNIGEGSWASDGDMIYASDYGSAAGDYHGPMTDPANEFTWSSIDDAIRLRARIDWDCNNANGEVGHIVFRVDDASDNRMIYIRHMDHWTGSTNSEMNMLDADSYIYNPAASTTLSDWTGTVEARILEDAGTDTFFDIDDSNVASTDEDDDNSYDALYFFIEQYDTTTVVNTMKIDYVFVTRYAGVSEPEQYNWQSVETLVPTNDDCDITNMDDTNNLYARYKNYTGTANVSTQSSYTDIDYVEWHLLTSDYTLKLEVKYNVSADTFTEVSATGFDFVSGTGTGSGTDLDITINFEVEWSAPDESNYMLNLHSVIGSEHDYDNYTSYCDVETRLDASSYSLDDGLGLGTRGDKSQIDYVNCSGVGVYFGSSLHPPVAEVDVYITTSSFNLPQTSEECSNYEATGGTFSCLYNTSGATEQVGYYLKFVSEGGGAGGTSLLHATHYENYITDQLNFTATTSLNWVLAGDTITVYINATYEYDDTVVPSVVWSNTDNGSVTYSTTGNRTWIAQSSGDTYGLNNSLAINTTAFCAWDGIQISSVAYYWVQYSVDQVFFIWNPSTFTWYVNGSTVQSGVVIQSQVNGTNDDFAVIVTGGTCGDFALSPPFNTDWYGANITFYAQTGSYNWSIWSQVLSVDILHSVHIEDSTFYLTDNWVTVGFQTNWNNGTFYVYDNGSYVGGSYMGLYQFAKSSTVGLHNLTVIVNGTQASIDNSSQDYTLSSGDGWKVLNFKYTVNPVTFSMTDIVAWQDNSTIVVGAIFYTSDLTIDYTIYEDGLGVGTGTVTLTASGEYNVIKWTKVNTTDVVNWTVKMQAGSTNISIHGYNLILYNEVSYTSSGYWEGDTFVMGEAPEVAVARASEAMWDTVSMILVFMVLPLVAGIAIKVDRSKSAPRGKRDKEYDNLR